MRRATCVGLGLAVLAEVCSVGLLGLSGWFIATSAVAGAAVSSSFSYLAPSGGVRSFALGRIAGTYASRVVLHAAALGRIGDARLGFYDRTAATSGRAWSGQSLDRVLADADTAGMALIQATTPAVVAAAISIVGCLVVVLAGQLVAAVVLAIGVAVCAALAVRAASGTGDASEARGGLRRELVIAVEARTEMASLGAIDQLADRSIHHVASYERRRSHQAVSSARSAVLARVVSVVDVLIVAATTSARGAPVASLVFVVLVAGGVLASAERMVPASEARTVARQADRRLRSADVEISRVRVDDFRAWYDARGLTVSGYQLPETPSRPARRVDVNVAPGRTLMVTGPSGSGKTTFLDALATELRTAGCRVTSVLAEDYVFTGTVADNIRLADPTATDGEIAALMTAMLLDGAGLEPGSLVGVHGREVSGGEARRLHLARALATRPDVLLIDEPVTGLDPSTAAHVLDEIRGRCAEIPIVLAMHRPGSGALSDHGDGVGVLDFST